MEQETIDRSGQIALSLSAVSAPRVDRLRDRHAETKDWPIFRRLYFMRESRGDTIELTSEEFDALVAVWQFVHGEAELPDEVFDFVMDALVRKVGNKGGAKCDPSQVQDIAYEAEVALLFARFMPGWAKIELEDDHRPDHVFRVHFYMSDHPSEIAIECKNIRRHRSDLRDLMRSVTGAIESAVRQHQARPEQFTDLLVFIDLPIGVLGFPPADYYRLIVTVWNQLKLDGFEDIDETQVIFTATSQEGMGEYLRMGPDQPRSLTLLRPHTIGRTSVCVRVPRLVFLSFLFRNLDENANIENWSKVAINIEDPGQYLLC